MLMNSQVAGNVTKMPAKELNSVALNFFAARTVYTLLYITIKNNVLAYVGDISFLIDKEVC